MQRFTYIMVCDQYTHAALPEIFDNLLYICYGYRIYSGKWFIKQYELRLKSQAASNLDASSLTARKL